MTDTTPRYRIGSLFSGYGGTDLAVLDALGSAGLRGQVIWHSDIKPAAVTLLAYHYPGVPNLGDLTQIWPVDRNHPQHALPARDTAPIDVLVASWPCQPESAAGLRLGEKDPRALWPHVARAIEVTRPTIFFGENVARITSNGSLRRVVRSLAQLGYMGAWRVLSAADQGACHLRKRCFVVAVDSAAHLGRETGWLAGHTRSNHSAGTTSLRTAQPSRRDHCAVTLLPTPTRRDIHGAGTQGRQGGLNLRTAVTLLPTPTARDVKGPRPRGPRRDGYRRSIHQTDLASATISLLPTPCASSYGTNHGGGAGRVGPVRESLDTMARHGRFDRWGIYAAAIARHEIVRGRPAPTPTQISAKNGTPRLSARFVEWMMMLPEGWITGVPNLVDSPRRSERLAMLSLLGDGVVPVQAAAAFRFLLNHLTQRLDTSMTA